MLSSTPSAGQGIQVHGHRGARAVLPENTVPAFEHAIAVGADVLELDLAVTRDNLLVVSHDPTLNPKFCRGPGGSTVIRELSLAQLRRWDCGAVANPDQRRQKAMPGTRIPTLEEVLALAPLGKFHFNIETKIFKAKPEYTPAPEEFARMLVQAVRKHKLEERVIIQSFDFRTLEAARQLAPEIRRSALYDGPPRDLVQLTQLAQAQICSPEHPLVTRQTVTALHKAGLQVVPWTANEPADWDRLIEAGVDGIITDDPEALIEYLKTRKLR
jgi:glycerophosphoryl diester phosphodiesterase